MGHSKKLPVHSRQALLSARKALVSNAGGQDLLGIRANFAASQQGLAD